METTNEISTWLLILTLFLPRLGLFLAWISGNIPYNTIPFIGDAVMAIFLPRLLMIIYIVGIYGYTGWFWAHMIAWLLAIISGFARYSPDKK